MTVNPGGTTSLIAPAISRANSAKSNGF
jgi:hypothetical protein